ncbi:MAG: hypothetical protein U0K81_04980 [Paludibacteraceae bacterium]|nr:hypothetical protein [Paludibacteraceae bacterium]
MKSNSEICEDVARSGVIERAMRIHRVTAEYSDDLRQEVLLLLMELDNTRLNDILANDKLDAFVNRIVRNMWKSKTSRFYYKYRKNETQTTASADFDRLITDDD